jgi:hypothetical protein
MEDMHTMKNDIWRSGKHLVLINVGVQELAVGGVDDGGSVRGCKDMACTI